MRRLLLLSAAYLVMMPLSAVGGTPQSPSPMRVVLTKLHEPLYPRSAQAAAIQGTVELAVEVNKGGEIVAVNVVSGAPILLPSAIDSARNSTFECQECDDAAHSYQLTYEYRIVATDPEQYCKTYNEQLSPKFDASLHKVDVFAKEFWTCDGTSEVSSLRVRSAKCLYLWKCGSRPEDKQRAQGDSTH